MLADLDGSFMGFARGIVLVEGYLGVGSASIFIWAAGLYEKYSAFTGSIWGRNNTPRHSPGTVTCR